MSATKEGLEFLEELTRYVDWRLKENTTEPEPTEFIDRFRAYLLSRGAKIQGEGFQFLVAHMTKMKKSRGVINPT